MIIAKSLEDLLINSDAITVENETKDQRGE